MADWLACMFHVLEVTVSNHDNDFIFSMEYCIVINIIISIICTCFFILIII